MTQSTAANVGPHAKRFGHDRYTIRRKVFKLLGAAFHVYDAQQNLVLYSKQKAFKLKEDIRLYSDESMGTELISIAARSIIDFSAAYDVIDSQARQKVGALKRKGFSSMLRDEWVIMDARDNPIGTLREDSMTAALVRRFVEAAAFFFPQKFHAEVGGQTVCTFQQNFNPFVRKLEIDFSQDANCVLDRRLGIAAAVLLAAIEGKEE
jgi:uncharacterized protein YxjI